LGSCFLHFHAVGDLHTVLATKKDKNAKKNKAFIEAGSQVTYLFYSAFTVAATIKD
jgi:hypothetical protein